MIFKGIGVIWDKDKNKALAEFAGGKFETEDSEIIEKMVALGVEHEAEEEKIPEEIPKAPPRKPKAKKGSE